MQIHRVIIMAGLLVKTSFSLQGQSAVCAWEPAAIVEAGSVISATFNNPWSSRCEVTLQFSDPAYLPVTWTFDPVVCKGQQIGQFSVPQGAPNGDAVVTWRCAGQDSPSCNHVLIRNGLGNMESEELLRLGRVGCITSFFQTTTAMETQTSSSTTLTRLLSSIRTIPTTVFSSPSTRAIPGPEFDTTSTSPATLTTATLTTAMTTDPVWPTTTAGGGGAATTNSITTNMDGSDPGSTSDATTITAPVTQETLTTAATTPILPTTPVAVDTNVPVPTTTTPTDLLTTTTVPDTTKSNVAGTAPLDRNPTTVAVVTMTVTEAGACSTTFTA
ncbi:hypothetical protein CNYM01_11245 [Colletotrichum nymphaeae SA-01]|uniref:Uncharacterized protein n=1 Tax=Colletotrichum nymphaeae SA-01 TaxID=1460502 RepID=A0A135RY66_9PEZI|nr:hypothetical protein CNYM01_11245 [Colletotrichum nymphaeae SA-01]